MSGPAHPGSLKPAHGATRRGRYVGRGESSGHGKTSGRGIKGQMSRSGSGRRPGFVGGDLPFWMRLPKRGFYAPGKVHYRLVNLWQLDNCFEAGAEVTPQAMLEKGLISGLKPGVKILGEGELKKALKVSAHAFSGGAREKITAAGGACTVLELEPGATK